MKERGEQDITFLGVTSVSLPLKGSISVKKFQKGSWLLLEIVPKHFQAYFNRVF